MVDDSHKDEEEEITVDLNEDLSDNKQSNGKQPSRSNDKESKQSKSLKINS